MSRPIFGYEVPPDAKTYNDWTKNETAEDIYREWLRLLQETLDCTVVADWLNANGVPLGKYARTDKWTGKAVRRITANSILRGMPGRGWRHSVKHHETGRRQSQRNPKGPVFKEFPDLAFWSPAEWDEINNRLASRNAGLGRKPVDGVDPRAGIFRRQTRWPGQHVQCGICNRPYYWGGHGVKEHMMCSGTHAYRCWNAATFDGVVAATRLFRAVLSEVETLPNFDEELFARIRERLDGRSSTHKLELTRVRSQINDNRMQQERIAEAIAQGGPIDALVQKLNSLKLLEFELVGKEKALLRHPPNIAELPTMESIRSQVRQAGEDLDKNSAAFGSLMHRIIPSLRVHPFRLIDGGAIVLRAEVVLDLTNLTNLRQFDVSFDDVLRRRLIVDLFDPPQRVQYRERVVQMRKTMSERRVARELQLTVTATQRAMSLHRMMEERGLTDPYLRLGAPPDDCTKVRRHLHPRFRFEPLPPSAE